MIRALVLLVLLLTPARAQAPDVSLQRAIAVLQMQRNQAMDTVVNLEVQRALLTEEIERLRAKLTELEKAQSK